MILNWKVTPREFDLIDNIAERAIALSAGGKYGKLRKQDLLMDLTACHNHGCRLDLETLSLADSFDFTHDVFGIQRHLDRNTGELTDCFVPRHAAKESARA